MPNYPRCHVCPIVRWKAVLQLPHPTMNGTDVTGCLYLTFPPATLRFPVHRQITKRSLTAYQLVIFEALINILTRVYPGYTRRYEMLCQPPVFNITRQRHDAVLFGVDDIAAYAHAGELLRLLKENGFRTGLAASGRNHRSVVSDAGVEHLFDVLIDGHTSEQPGFESKPEPDVFLEIVGRIGVSPERTVLFGDTVSGIKAGRRRKFESVLGVDGAGHGGDLEEVGADIVVSTFAELAVEGERPWLKYAVAELPSALESISEIRGFLEGNRSFVALDYDGTLTPIVEQPDHAVLSTDMQNAVVALAKECTVAVISGRDRKDVQRFVGIDDLFYAGSHGFDISGPAGRRVDSQMGNDFLPLLDRAEQSARAHLNHIPGVLIERKKFSIAVHYRGVEEGHMQEVRNAVDRVREEHDGIRKNSGKKVFQLQPDIDWNKGRALCWLMNALDLDSTGVLPLYIGDDVTDEDAFRVLQDDGVGIVVKGDDASEVPQRSAARYALDNSKQVHAFLLELTKVLSLKEK